MNQPAIDIIGDVHGMYGRLMGLLANLGYHREGGRWRHAKDRRIVFVGDYIDRGGKSREVVETVRQLCSDRIALALAGNHDTNAIAFCTRKDTGALNARAAYTDRKPQGVKISPWRRPHTEENLKQHSATLDSFDNVGEYENAIHHFATLPIWLELPKLRVVHAAWIPLAIEKLDQWATLNHLDRLGIRAACINEAIEIQTSRRCPSAPLWAELLDIPMEEKAHEQRPDASVGVALERLVKGVEMALPKGESFKDGEGRKRNEIRIRWFEAAAGRAYHAHGLMRREDVESIRVQLQFLHNIPASKDDDDGLKLSVLIPFSDAYSEAERPVVFGHYALYDMRDQENLMGGVLRRSPNAANVACVDNGGGFKDGSLSAYRWDGERVLNACKFIHDDSPIDPAPNNGPHGVMCTQLSNGQL